jgi:hypothetical protein
MKKLFIIILILFVCGSVTAAIMGSLFSPQSFDVDIIQHPHMVLLDNQKYPEMKVDYTFTDEKKTYQLRYSLFKQIENTDQDVRMLFSVYILPIMLNISGNEMNNGNITRFDDDDVKNEFNGDFGTAVSIERPQSEFGKGYRYIMMNIYCKKNQGIVAQSILFNNTNILKNRQFDEVFHSFKFKD